MLCLRPFVCPWITAPGITRPLCNHARHTLQLLRDQVYFFQSRVNYQPAFSGSGFMWHSDFEVRVWSVPKPSAH